MVHAKDTEKKNNTLEQAFCLKSHNELITIERTTSAFTGQRDLCVYCFPNTF